MQATFKPSRRFIGYHFTPSKQLSIWYIVQSVHIKKFLPHTSKQRCNFSGTILTIAGLKGMIAKHYDVETAYLNGDLSHEVYMKQPEGYQEGGHKIVCKLQKNLYGLKQGANEWNRKFNDILITNGFK